MQNARLTFSFLVCLCLTAALASAAPFVSPRGGYSLSPPAGWRIDNSHTPGNDVTLFAPHGSAAGLSFVPVFGVKIIPGSGNLTPEDLKQPLADGYRKNFAPATILSETYSTVGGIRAIDVVFTHPRSGSMLRDHQIIVIKGKSIYFFTAVCPDKVHAKYDPAFAQLLASVRWR